MAPTRKVTGGKSMDGNATGGKAKSRREGGALTSPPRSGKEMRALARAAALPAIARLAALSASEDERVALAATQELLNRAFGKTAAAADDARRAPAQRLVIKILRFGAEERAPGSAERPTERCISARSGGPA